MVTVDGLERPLRPEGQGLSLPLVPGTQQVCIQWRQPDALASYYSPSVLDLGTSGVNASTRIDLGGPLGPVHRRSRPGAVRALSGVW